MINAEEFSGRNVLITGGLGFIGSAVARRLVAAGARVTLIDSMIPTYGGNLFNIHGIEDRVHVNISDVRDGHAMAHLIQGKDYLFNLAGQTSHLDSMSDPQTDLDINVGAQLSILEACRKHNRGIRIVFASTRQIYGRPEYLPVDEAHPIRPVDVNGIHKLAGEQYHLLYHSVYGIHASALRLTNTYGPGMRVKDARQTFLGIWIRRLLEGDPIVVFGDGSQLRDFTYVDDAVDALLLAAMTPAVGGKVINLGGEPPVSLKDVAEMMTTLRAGGTVDYIPFPEDRVAIDIGDYYGDFAAARDTLGWSPSVSLMDGLRSTLAFYEENLEHYV